MLGRVVMAMSAVLLILVIASASAVTQKSTLTWPIAAPTRVAATAPDYVAAGWAISSPFGWRSNPERPGAWELHEGADLSGPMFCLGCAVPPLGDIAVAHVGWDQEWNADPLHSGAGVVVDMELQHPEESGTLRVRYGHLQPYHVFVRTRSCTQTVDCPDYHNDSAGAVTITCPGTVVRTAQVRGMRAYAYATPGRCTASVAWPATYLPSGDTTIAFDQRIAPGVASSDAAITFTAQLPPPPPPITPTASLPLPRP